MKGMKVKVLVQGELREKVGPNVISIPIKTRETVDTLLIKLSRRNPDLVESILNPKTGDLKDEFNITLNGRSIKQIKGLYTRLKNKDEIAISRQSE
ncbi:hypothetical protein AKJ63_00015 [candidate division MSBL1 archaeon SCGC-AAA259D18]|uniref:Uncharacterized protein n=1 Tax=candidate division MSBL1 archaeon SCGC-AAA259D18 TaxID=1698262 RepID=A0A133UCW6_9EURY|nr:hypothetical protein AKJ63_00015 [candidate division MSBL1 archaeon SCGC-AAA259D18]